MSWKNWIPFYGEKTVRKKLRELDRAGVGVPMFIVLFLQKGFETLLRSIGRNLPFPIYFTYFFTAALVFVSWVYDKELRAAADKAKEKGKEKVEEKTS